MPDPQPIAQPQPPRAGAHGADLVGYSIAFGLLFVAGFAVVALVLMTRRKRS